MNISNILTSKQINPSKAILRITAEETLYSLKEALEEFSLNIDFNKLSKEELGVIGASLEKLNFVVFLCFISSFFYIRNNCLCSFYIFNFSKTILHRTMWKPLWKLHNL